MCFCKKPHSPYGSKAHLKELQASFKEEPKNLLSRHHVLGSTRTAWWYACWEDILGAFADGSFEQKYKDSLIHKTQEEGEALLQKKVAEAQSLDKRQEDLRQKTYQIRDRIPEIKNHNSLLTKPVGTRFIRPFAATRVDVITAWQQDFLGLLDNLGAIATKARGEASCLSEPLFELYWAKSWVAYAALSSDVIET